MAWRLMLTGIGHLANALTVFEYLKPYLDRAVTAVDSTLKASFEAEVQEHMNGGMSRAKAEVYACSTLGWMDSDPEAVCRLRNIK